MAGFFIPSRGTRRRGRRNVFLFSALATTVLVGSLVVGHIGPAAQADQTTQGTDNLRTNWDQGEPGLSPAVVQSSSFGQLFATQLDGQIYAQPLVVGDQVIAVTESNTMYGLDRMSGAVKWSHHYGSPWPASAINCGDLAPNVGATATPVYDPTSNAVYFTTKIDVDAAHLQPTWAMHAVDPLSGAELPGWPVTISGSPSNDPSATFDAFHEQQRPGLLLMDGVVYAGFGGHCDAAPYRGYVVGVSTTTHSQTSMWTAEVGPGVTGAGVWQSGGGLVSDGPGRIFFSTGNGISPAPGAGTTTQGVLAESVVRLQVNADKSLSTADFFSPTNAPTLDLNDLDISSGAPMALPDGFGSNDHRHLLVMQGKDGRVFLLDRDNLGGSGQGASGSDAVVSMSGPFQGLWGHPALWGGDGGYVYVVGNGGPLRALKYGLNNGTPSLTLTGQSQDSFGYTSGSPLVTSDGTTGSSALVWMVSANGPSGTNGALRAYDPVPDGNGQLQLLWSAPIGNATKFSTPTASGGKVYVGTRDGLLYGYGSPAATAVTASPVEFGQLGVGSTGSAVMTLTAAQDVTVTGLSVPAGAFSVTAPALPVVLTAGSKLDLPVGFAPTATGGVSGMLTATLSDGQKLLFALHGVGTRPGLGAAPAQIAFGEIPTGSTKTLNLQVTNTGTDAESIDAITAPSGSFLASGLPDTGTVVPVGGSFVASVTYTPAGTDPAADSLKITSSSAGETHLLSVPLSGTPVTGQGHLEFSPSSLAFGAVPIGSSKTLSFTITNSGNLPVTVTKAKAPTGDFTSPLQLAEGLVIGPDQTAVQSVTFTPRSATEPASSYEVTGSDGTAQGTGQGAMYVPITGTGTGAAVSTSSKDGLWQANGSATATDDGGFQLNTTACFQSGSAVYTKPFVTDGLRATFTARFGPGSGADGLAFSLLDAAKNTPTALGASGSGLGISGQPGVTVGFETYTDNLPAMAPNYVGVGYSTVGSQSLTYLQTARLSTSLREGTHQVDVAVTGGHLLVSVDGVQQLDTTPTLPASTLIAFSGGTGGQCDTHTVSGLVVSGQPVSTPPAPTPTPTPTALPGYTPVGPTRILSPHALAAYGKLAVTVAGVAKVPANATAVLVNVGVSGTRAATGALMLEPHGAGVPNYGSLYWNTTTQSVQHTAVVSLARGAVDIYNYSTGSVPVYLDVLGYYAPQTGKQLVPIRTANVLSTALGVGQSTRTPLGAKRTVSVMVRGTAGVPATATSVVLNLSEAGPLSAGGLVVWPHGVTSPGLPVLSWDARGEQLANLVTVPIGSNGMVDFYNTGIGSVQVTATAVGYYATTTGRTFVPAVPLTILDTRYGIGRSGTAPLAGAGVLKVQVTGTRAVPLGATAVLVQLGTVSASGGGSLTAWGDGVGMPTVPNLYWTVGGRRTTDLAVVPLLPNGKLDLRNNAGTSVAAFAVVLGYWH